MTPSQADDLGQARSLLGRRPDLALVLARRILQEAPGHLEARLILGAAMRRSGSIKAARGILVPLAERQPKAWGLQFEAGAVLAMGGETDLAIAALRRALRLNPKSSLAWHALGDQLALLGEQSEADQAHRRVLPGSVSDPELIETARGLFDGRPDQAEIALGDRFGLHLTDPVAAALLGDVGERLGQHRAVERFMGKHLGLTPQFAPLRLRRAIALFHDQRPIEALAEVEQMRFGHPDGVALRLLEAAVSVQLGAYERAIALYSALVEAFPYRALHWLAYGHALKTVGRQSDSVAAYRRSLALEPGFGEAYWSLANLKVVQFKPDDLTAMQALLNGTTLRVADQAPLRYALGKALEDEGRFEMAFAQYQEGAALSRARSPYDSGAHREGVKRMVATFTPEFFAAREGVGDPAKGPIFVVGLPRSGSTLVEQILASHSAVEGLSELPDITLMARELAGQDGDPDRVYPGSLGHLDAAGFAVLGATYLERTSLYRKQDRAFFVDKFPGNFVHLGLIRLILPGALIIDVRRHPMACCFSLFKQHFAQGQAYSNDLTDLGLYYTDYLALMAHVDQALPGWVHHLQYEALIRDPESEIRRLLLYCGLPFEDQCLRFHESRRPVRTASSEQVRRPISSAGIEHWRRFEPWLQPLNLALARSFDLALDRPDEA